jgi:hypothetical protein
MTQQAFLVLGMHRSGTSAVARLVNLAGAAISDQLMAPQSDNPTGFWESLPIAELHDRALAQLGLAWDSIERVPDEWFRSTETAELRAELKAHITADFPHGESFVMKDPRACRLVPVWLDVLAELKYRAVAIMPVRNPIEVARSLERRNGFPVAKSLLLWLRHVVDAEAYTRQVPRALIGYARLLECWRAELEEVNRQLGFRCFGPNVFFEERVDRFLSPSERHYVASPDALVRADRHGWASEAFAALETLRGPADAATLGQATRTLDRARESLDGAVAVLEPFLDDYRTGLRSVRSASAATEARLSAAEAEARRVGDLVAETGRTADQLRAQLDEAHKGLHLRQAALDDGSARLDELQQALARAQGEVVEGRTRREALEHELTSVGAEAASLRASLDEQVSRREAERSELLQQLAAMREDAERRHIEASRLAEALNGQLDESRSALAELQKARTRLDAKVVSLDRDRERLRQASECAEREARRLSALSRAGSLRSRDAVRRFRALVHLLSDAQVPPSRWLADPVQSARNLLRLGGRDYRRRVTLLARSGLFDLDYYSRNIGGPPTNLPARFLLRGDVAGERTHRLFDPEWYRHEHPDLSSEIPPLQHYLTTGGWERRAPHPLFDPPFYLSQWNAGEVTGVSPLSHFLEVGGAAGVSPHPLFDAFHYLCQRPDVAADGTNPLLHYVTAPAGDAADPHPLFSNRYYLERNPDVTGTSALEHFVRHGAAEGRSPHPLFDVEYYWRQRPEVRARGENALRHFLQAGSSEGVDPHPLFSCRHYESQFSEPWDRRVNPLVHYLRWGSLDARNPHPSFDGARYLEAYSDVAASGTDPLIHFVLHGAQEGRRQFHESAPGDRLG